jgi:hypothetical protein
LLAAVAVEVTAFLIHLVVQAAAAQVEIQEMQQQALQTPVVVAVEFMETTLAQMPVPA